MFLNGMEGQEHSGFKDLHRILGRLQCPDVEKVGRSMSRWVADDALSGFRGWLHSKDGWGGTETIHTVGTALVQTCIGIQVLQPYLFVLSTYSQQTIHIHKCSSMYTVHTQYIQFIHCAYMVHTLYILEHLRAYIVHTMYIRCDCDHLRTKKISLYILVYPIVSYYIS